MIFIDTNVIVDLAMSERRFHRGAKTFFEDCAKKKAELYSLVLCLGTFCYLLESKARLNHKQVKEWLHKLTKLITLVSTKNLDIRQVAFFGSVINKLRMFFFIKKRWNIFKNHHAAIVLQQIYRGHPCKYLSH